MHPLDDLHLERVAAGKELRAKAGAALDAYTQTARSATAAADNVNGLAADLRKALK